MSHRRRRISRVLLAVLTLTIAIGIFTYARRLNSTKANEVAGTERSQSQAPQPNPQPALASLPPVIGDATTEPVNPAQPQQPSSPLVTQTPTVTTTPPLSTTANATTDVPRPLAAPAGTSAASPAVDPVKVSIKPYQPPAGGGHSTPAGAEAIADGRTNLRAGKYLEARDRVNAALVSGRLRGADLDSARALLSEINQTVIFSNRKFADDRFGGTYQVQSGDWLARIGSRYGLTADMLMRINGLADARRLRAGAYIKVLKGPFHAVVSKSAFRLDLYLGGLPGSGPSVAYVTSFPVGLGKDDSTPLGKWQVEPDRKVKNPVYYSPRGEGVIEADDPANPLGEFWIGLAGLEGDAVGKESYGIHGTIEPDSIGRMESMGCIRLRNDDIAVIFAALVEGKSTVDIVP